MSRKLDENAGCAILFAMLIVSLAAGSIFGAAWGWLVFGAIWLALWFRHIGWRA